MKKCVRKLAILVFLVTLRSSHQREKEDIVSGVGGFATIRLLSDLPILFGEVGLILASDSSGITYRSAKITSQLMRYIQRKPYVLLHTSMSRILNSKRQDSIFISSFFIEGS